TASWARKGVAAAKRAIDPSRTASAVGSRTGMKGSPYRNWGRIPDLPFRQPVSLMKSGQIHYLDCTRQSAERDRTLAGWQPLLAVVGGRRADRPEFAGEQNWRS